MECRQSSHVISMATAVSECSFEYMLICNPASYDRWLRISLFLVGNLRFIADIVFMYKLVHGMKWNMLSEHVKTAPLMNLLKKSAYMSSLALGQKQTYQLG